MLGHSRGFSLVELIAVMVVMGVLAVSLWPTTDGTANQRLMTVRDDLLAALAFAQQIGMARSRTDNPVTFTYSATGFAVTENAVPLRNGLLQYPLQLPSGITLTASAASPVSFDKLGRTEARVFTLVSGSVATTVTLSGAGYAQ